MKAAIVYWKKKSKGFGMELGKERVPNVTDGKNAREKFSKKWPGRTIIGLDIIENG